ncbi:MAG: zinc-ribbon domain-containing protein [Planctomycetota bacterium]|jgi:predicted Zn finger-like uncharacterized protein
MIRTVCQNCQASFQVPEDLVGKKVRCAKCASVMRIAPAGTGTSIFEDENWLDGGAGDGAPPATGSNGSPS